MATITTPVYLEDAARSAGESMTINGGRLTVRTDTRWHANSPASMTGSLGSVTISATLGGGYTLDGTTVRWLPYDSGSGNVPAVGTTVSQGGVSGYFLGCWAGLTSAPAAVGAAVPASGFIKLREVSGGLFSSGALSGIGASATGADVVGWIEVVHDQSTAITVPRLGDFTVRGDWFSLGTTSGSANQLFQVPTNGSSTTYVPGVWIATTDTPTTDEDWEFYPAIYAAGMTTTNLGTDVRSKFVCRETDGQIRIGHNGTTNVGYVPPAGREVRIPNVLGRQCTAGARALNEIPSSAAATRPDFTTTGAGYIDIENFATDWYLSFAQPYYVKLRHVATFDYIGVSECATALDIYDGGNGVSQSIDARTVTLTSNFAGGTVEKWKAYRFQAGTTDHAFEVLYCVGQTFDRCESGIITFARSTGVAFAITQSADLTFNECRAINHGWLITTCFNLSFVASDYCDRFVGATTTTGVIMCTITSSCDGIVWSGLTTGYGGAVANCHPYTGYFSVTLSKNVKIRSIGSRGTFLSGGSANNPGYIFSSGGNNQNAKVQRVYISPIRTAALVTLNSDKDNVYEHVYGDMGDTQALADLNNAARNCGWTNSTTGQTSVYGTHWSDAFTGDTAGRVVLAMNEPTAETADQVDVVAGAPKFTSAGGLVMASVNDEVIFEMPYFVLGCTGLPNTAPVVTGTNVTYVSGPDWGNHDIYFQIDVNDGAGWNGSWLDLTGANLNSFTGDIDPALGFKLKLRVVCDTASTTNLISYIRIATDSTLAAQTNNLYPLDTFALTLTGLQTGSDVVVLEAGTETVLDSADAVSSFSFVYETPEPVDIAVYKTGYVPFFIRNYSLPSSNASLPVAQVIDRAYLA